MASCRSFITALMKFDHSGLLISKGSCFFKCFPLGLSLLATQLRIAAGGPNPVLLTTKLHVCNKRRVSYGQEKEWISIRISSFYWLCLQEMQCSPCILLAANASVNPDIRTQTSPYLPAHSLKASKKLTERCSYFSPPPPPPPSPGLTSRGHCKLAVLVVTSMRCARGSCSMGILSQFGDIKTFK